MLANSEPDQEYYAQQEKIIQEYRAQLEREAEEARLKLLSEELTAKAKKLVGTRQGQCVIAVRSFLGVDRSVIQGAARSTKTNSKTWAPGAIVVFRMSSVGHVGVALSVDSEGYLWYYDSNGDWSQRGAIRKIKLDSNLIVGYKVIK